MSEIQWTNPDCEVIDALAYVRGTSRVENLVGVPACLGPVQKVKLRGAPSIRRGSTGTSPRAPTREFKLCSAHREFPALRGSVLDLDG
jgi:hypothetical protein